MRAEGVGMNGALVTLANLSAIFACPVLAGDARDFGQFTISERPITIIRFRGVSHRPRYTGCKSTLITYGKSLDPYTQS